MALGRWHVGDGEHQLQLWRGPGRGGGEAWWAMAGACFGAVSLSLFQPLSFPPPLLSRLASGRKGDESRGHGCVWGRGGWEKWQQG